jgi:hypothetical protein
MARRHMKEHLAVDASGWLVSESGIRVAVCPPNVGVPIGKRLRNARRLAECWNHHDDLVAIVEELMGCMELADEPLSRTNVAIKKAEALLKKVQK